MLDTLEKKLDQHYRRHGIHPKAFECKHYADCSSSVRKFSKARMPAVGRRYFDSVTPRIVVVSLDPGREDREPHERTMDVMKGGDAIHTWHKGRHWYRTHEFVWHLIRPFDSSLQLEDSAEHFAHVNSAKCCANLSGNRQAPDRLFKNCRWYLPEELQILKPDVIVTQGDYARDAFRGAFPMEPGSPSGCGQEGHKCWRRVIEMPGGRRVLWLHSYHPNQASGYYTRHKEGYFSCYPEFLKRFRNGA